MCVLDSTDKCFHITWFEEKFRGAYFQYFIDSFNIHVARQDNHGSRNALVPDCFQGHCAIHPRHFDIKDDNIERFGA